MYIYVWRYNVINGQFESTPNTLPTGLAGGVAVSNVGGVGYIFGGATGGGNYTNQLESFPGVASVGPIVISSKPYLFGGNSSQSLTSYNTATNNWQTTPTAIPARSNAASCVDSQGNGYIYGGNGATGALNDMWKVTPAGAVNQILFNSSSPGGLYNWSTAWSDTSGGNCYFFGGDNSAGNQTNSIWQFNIPSAKWTRIAESGDTIESRDNSVSFVDGQGNAYIFGGYVRATESTGPQRNDLYQINLTSKVVTQLLANSPSAADRPSPRSAARVVAITNPNSVNPYILLYGGRNDRPGFTTTIFNDAWLYNIDNNKWTKLATSNAPQLSYQAMWYDTNTKLVYLYGGVTPSLVSTSLYTLQLN